MASPLCGSIHHARKSATQLSASGVAGSANVGPDTAGRAVAADHVKELMRGKMRQLVETDQRDLRPLPGVDRAVDLQVRELDPAGPRPAPLAQSDMRDPAE